MSTNQPPACDQNRLEVGAGTKFESCNITKNWNPDSFRISAAHHTGKDVQSHSRYSCLRRLSADRDFLRLFERNEPEKNSWDASLLGGPSGACVQNELMTSQTISPSEATWNGQPLAPLQISVFPSRSRCAPKRLNGKESVGGVAE